MNSPLEVLREYFAPIVWLWRKVVAHEIKDDREHGQDMSDTLFEEWFKAQYIKRGFVSSKDELREAWMASAEHHQKERL